MILQSLAGLPTFFEDDPRTAELGGSYVRKPLLSREGATEFADATPHPARCARHLLPQGEKEELVLTGYMGNRIDRRHG
jgi:hypothetical protein